MASAFLQISPLRETIRRSNFCWRFCVCVLVAVGTVPHPAFASLNPDKAISQYTRQFWGTDAGLPQQSVTALAQTADGFLWLGTEDGLVRFDGIQFSTFDKSNTPGLRSNLIKALHVDRKGVLWVGTRGGGVAKYWNGTVGALTSPSELATASVSAFLESQDGSMWIGTDDSGLYQLANGRLKHFGKHEGLTTNSVYTLAADSHDLWVGTDSGLFRFRDGNFSCLSKKDGLPGNQIRALQVEDDDSLWVGADDGLVNIVKGEILHVTSRQERLPVNSITRIYRDRIGTLWIGTLETGLLRIVKGHIESFSNRDGLSGSGIWSILEDREGNIWLGETDGGLGCLREGIFTPMGQQQGLVRDTVTAIFEGRDRTLWFGSDGGLTRIKDGHVSVYTVKQGLPDNLVLSLAEDGSGDLWVGTRTGLARFHDGAFTRIGEAENFNKKAIVLSAFSDHSGTLWVGTRGTLSKLQGNQFVNFSAADGIPPSLIIAIQQSRDGTLWIGTDGGGLLSLVNGKLRRYTNLDGLPTNAIWAISPDEDGSLWLGTNGGGLVHFDKGRFTAFQKNAGLSDDVIFQILDDKHDGLWMSSNKGVFAVRKKDLHDFSSHLVDSIRSNLYGPSDGLRGRECNGGFQPAGWRTTDGKLWFPTMRGAAVVNPAALGAGIAPPAPILEGFTAGRFHGRLSESISLPPDIRQMEIRFTAPEYSAPERVQFRYQLDGFDKDWISAGSRRIAYYTNVPPGDYYFRVQACLGDHCSTSAPSALIRLKPAFYETRLFVFFVVVALALIVFTLHRVRIRSLTAQEQKLRALVEERTWELRESRDQLRASHEQLEVRVAERTQELSLANAQLESEITVRREAELKADAANRAKSEFLTNMSHELRTPINGIMGMTEIMLCTASDPDQLEYLEIVKTSAHSLLGIVNDILDFSNIESHKLQIVRVPFSLSQRITQLENLFSAKAREKGLTFTLPSVPRDIDQLIGDPERLHQILLNLVDNALKFTQAGSVSLALKVMARNGSDILLSFAVSDTGIGIPQEKMDVIFQAFSQADYSSTRKYGGTGLGLAIASQLVQLMGGQLCADSTVGQGTTFTFTAHFDLPPQNVQQTKSGTQTQFIRA